MVDSGRRKRRPAYLCMLFFFFSFSFVPHTLIPHQLSIERSLVFWLRVNLFMLFHRFFSFRSSYTHTTPAEHRAESCVFPTRRYAHWYSTPDAANVDRRTYACCSSFFSFSCVPHITPYQQAEHRAESCVSCPPGAALPGVRLGPPRGRRKRRQAHRFRFFSFSSVPHITAYQ